MVPARAGAGSRVHRPDMPWDVGSKASIHSALPALQVSEVLGDNSLLEGAESAARTCLADFSLISRSFLNGSGCVHSARDF